MQRGRIACHAAGWIHRRCPSGLRPPPAPRCERQPSLLRCADTNVPQAGARGHNSLGDRRRRIGSRQSDDERRTVPITSAPTTYVQDATTARVKQYNANYSSRTDAIHVQTTVPSDTHHVTPTSERPIADSENSISLRHFILNHFNTEKGRQNSLYENA